MGADARGPGTRNINGVSAVCICVCVCGVCASACNQCMRAPPSPAAASPQLLTGRPEGVPRTARAPWPFQLCRTRCQMGCAGSPAGGAWRRGPSSAEQRRVRGRGEGQGGALPRVCVSMWAPREGEETVGRRVHARACALRTRARTINAWTRRDQRGAVWLSLPSAREAASTAGRGERAKCRANPRRARRGRCEYVHRASQGGAARGRAREGVCLRMAGGQEVEGTDQVDR